MSLVSNVEFVVPTAKKTKFFQTVGFSKASGKDYQFTSTGEGLLDQLLEVPYLYPTCFESVYAKQVTEQPVLNDDPDQHLIMREKVSNKEHTTNMYT